MSKAWLAASVNEKIGIRQRHKRRDNIAIIAERANNLLNRTELFDWHFEQLASGSERLLSPSLRGGANYAPGLLFDMNMLFQEAVAGALRRRAELEDVEIEMQVGEQHLALVSGTAKRRAFGLEPDLVLRLGRKIVAIGDTKWKRLEVGASGTLVPDRDDMFQMLAYAAAYRCADLVLIYPWHSGLAGSAETRFELSPIGDLRPVVSIVCVDMRSPAMSAIRGADSAGWSSLLRRESVA